MQLFHRGSVHLLLFIGVLLVLVAIMLRSAADEGDELRDPLLHLYRVFKKCKEFLKLLLVIVRRFLRAAHAFPWSS